METNVIVFAYFQQKRANSFPKELTLKELPLRVQKAKCLS